MATKPASSDASGTDAPEMPDLGPQMKMLRTQFLMLGVMLGMIFLFGTIGSITGPALFSVIGFNGESFILTLMAAALIMIVPSTLLRNRSMDWKEMARVQKSMRAVRKEYMDAVRTNNTFKTKKMQGIQQEMSTKQLELSSKQMNNLVPIMLVSISIFAGMYYMMGTGDLDTIIDLPWAAGVDFLAIYGEPQPYLLPSWVFLYMAISIPFGQLLQKALRYRTFKRLLSADESVQAQATKKAS